MCSHIFSLTPWSLTGGVGGGGVGYRSTENKHFHLVFAASADDVGDDAANVQNIYILMRFADAFIQRDLQRGVGGVMKDMGFLQELNPGLSMVTTTTLWNHIKLTVTKNEVMGRPGLTIGVNVEM